MSLAEQTRQAVDRDPVLYAALGRDLINYTAAAQTLDLPGSQTAVVDALRRYAQAIEPPATEQPRIRLFRSGVPPAEDIPEVATEQIDGESAVVSLQNYTWPQLAVGLSGLAIADVAVTHVQATDTAAVIVVPQAASAEAVRVLEETLDR